MQTIEPKHHSFLINVFLFLFSFFFFFVFQQPPTIFVKNLQEQCYENMKSNKKNSKPRILSKTPDSEFVQRLRSDTQTLLRFLALLDARCGDLAKAQPARVLRAARAYAAQAADSNDSSINDNANSNVKDALRSPPALAIFALLSARLRPADGAVRECNLFSLMRECVENAAAGLTDSERAWLGPNSGVATESDAAESSSARQAWLAAEEASLDALEASLDSEAMPALAVSEQQLLADLGFFARLWRSVFHEQLHAVTVALDDDEFVDEQIRFYWRWAQLAAPVVRSGAAPPGPPFVIDVVWHAHQLDRARYASECKKYFGHVLPHTPRGRYITSGAPRVVGLGAELAGDIAYGFAAAYKRMLNASTCGFDRSSLGAVNVESKQHVPDSILKSIFGFFVEQCVSEARRAGDTKYEYLHLVAGWYHFAPCFCFSFPFFTFFSRFRAFGSDGIVPFGNDFAPISHRCQIARIVV